METIKALAEALNQFSGGILLISHDQYFIKQVCNELWVLENKSIKAFNDTFEAYKKNTISKNKIFNKPTNL
jgi:ATP-binding cassette subfamily F protein 3